MIKYLVVHCSDSPNHRVDNRYDGAGTVHRWHLERGFDGIGYHFVIEENGELAYGRPIFPTSKTIWRGAHVSSHNHESIGLCLIGQDYFHDEQLKTLRYQLDYLKACWPDAAVVGHNDLDRDKTCPNFDVKAWYKTGKVQ